MFKFKVRRYDNGNCVVSEFRFETKDAHNAEQILRGFVHEGYEITVRETYSKDQGELAMQQAWPQQQANVPPMPPTTSGQF